jgi:hypothetical protein
MAKDSDKYRLWQHDLEPPKKSERTVIAKVSSVREDEAISYVDTPKTRRLR